ncbi:NUC173-domain-containing protein [Aulographum hederae CBS 113979]|uniref:NUC173-domain-containing protein n=1 Tax=Aulographum hederae CBS 113979 TaxID=1176131 RepID=A0A6G1HED2_9PEZI|nr:NUC173-domain-containing protein [Aulographum hederae CBS 113979]
MATTELEERLALIRNNPKQHNQQQTATTLQAVDDTLREQSINPTPAAYFSALLALLSRYISGTTPVAVTEVTTSVVYLLDLVTPHVAKPLLCTKFTQILTHLAPALNLPEAQAPLIRATIGCLESLLVVQDANAWKLAQDEVSPRRAVQGLLQLAVDHRPKVRKAALKTILNVLNSPPPSPRLDHPAADMCASTAISFCVRTWKTKPEPVTKANRTRDMTDIEPELIHAMQLIKTIASANGGWPSNHISALCRELLQVVKSKREWLVMNAFEVFEVIFEGMTDEMSSAKLPYLLETIEEVRPAKTDTQLLPPWLAVLSRAYDVSAQLDADEAFRKLPEAFQMVSQFLSSPSQNIRVSAAECLKSFLVNCVPFKVTMEPELSDDSHDILMTLANLLKGLLSVQYREAWAEVFHVLGTAFDVFRQHSSPLLNDVVQVVGEMRGTDAFSGKKQADTVLSRAIQAMGPDVLLGILPLNLIRVIPEHPGRVWLLPILRDSVGNTSLSQFRKEFVPLSEAMFQKVINHGEQEKTLEIKLYETVISQIWSIFPGYCDLPLDLTTAVDQSLCELLVTLLYDQPELRAFICRGLRNLVETNQVVAESEAEADEIILHRVTPDQAKANLAYLGKFASNMLAALFNVYTQTLPRHRGLILQCISAYLVVTTDQDRMDTFDRVSKALETTLAEEKAQNKNDKKAENASDNMKMPPMSQTLMDLVITISIFLPRDCYSQLFQMASLVVTNDHSHALQKKAYRLIPRLSESEQGRQALKERNVDLQQLLLNSADKATAPARHNRLTAMATVVELLPSEDLSFIPSVLPEVTMCTKDNNAKARAQAFDLLITMGEKMKAGGAVISSKIPHMGADAPNTDASLEEYFTMVSAGLAGTSPHSISASINAMTRIFYHFATEFSEEIVKDTVQTLDIFLTSKSHEIVRTAIGFVKVSVTSLPKEFMIPRLKSLIPNLMVWSHEHSGGFKLKIKHLMERMIRRFGYDVVEKNTPDQDKRLLKNIHKTKLKKKKSKTGGKDDSDDDAPAKPRKTKFDSEFDNAVYGSGDSEASGSDHSDDELFGKRQGGKAARAKDGGNRGTFIVEDEDEPLDLLGREALSNISSTRPQKMRKPTLKAKTNEEGKLVFNDKNTKAGADDDDGDEDMVDADADGGLLSTADGTNGVDDYTAAMKGANATTRDRKGNIRFSNKLARDEEMEFDEEELGESLQRRRKEVQAQSGNGRGRGGRGGAGRGRPVGRAGAGGRGGRGASGGRDAGGRGGFGAGRGGGGKGGRGSGMRAMKQQRRGLGAEKVNSGRIQKAAR